MNAWFSNAAQKQRVEAVTLNWNWKEWGEFVKNYMTKRPHEIQIKQPQIQQSEAVSVERIGLRSSMQYVRVRPGDSMYFANREDGTIKQFVVATKGGHKGSFTLTSTDGATYPLDHCSKAIYNAKKILERTEPLPKYQIITHKMKADNIVYRNAKEGDRFFYVDDDGEVIEFVVRAKMTKKDKHYFASNTREYPVARCRRRRDKAVELAKKLGLRQDMKDAVEEVLSLPGRTL